MHCICIIRTLCLATPAVSANPPPIRAKHAIYSGMQQADPGSCCYLKSTGISHGLHPKCVDLPSRQPMTDTLSIRSSTNRMFHVTASKLLDLSSWPASRDLLCSPGFGNSWILLPAAATFPRTRLVGAHWHQIPRAETRESYVTHDHGEGVGPGDRAEDVVGVLHVGDPVAMLCQFCYVTYVMPLVLCYSRSWGRGGARRPSRGCSGCPPRW